MRSETLLVIGWMSCTLEGEVLGFSLWGHFVLLCSAAYILPSGGIDTGLGEKILKWDWFYRWAEQTGESLVNLVASTYLKRYACPFFLFLWDHKFVKISLVKTCLKCFNIELLKIHKHCILGYFSVF